MKYFDRLLDSYEKRVFALYCSIVAILLFLGINAITLGNQFVKVTNMDTLYNLASVPSVESTLVGRTIVAYLMYNNLPNGFVRMLGFIFSFWHLLVIVLSALLLTSGKTNITNQRAKTHIITVVAIQIILTIIVLIGCVVVTQSTTTAIAIDRIHQIGVVYLTIQTILLITNVTIPFVLLYLNNVHSKE